MMEREQQLADAMARFARDPLGCVRFCFDWSAPGELQSAAGPRQWQADVLSHIGVHLSDPARRSEVCRVAVASGHGIGKSALIGMIIHWAMSTCVDCRVVITANTMPQLDTKTWPEVTKWFRRGINRHWWQIRSRSITAMDKLHHETWRTDAVTWSENNTEAFAGLHNQRKRIVIIFDEASAIAERVWEVTEGALTDEDTEIIWVAFGNPTQNTGGFREAFGKFRHRWWTLQVDSRTVEGTNKGQFEKWVTDYGEDSDFVRVRVRGEFPKAASTQFIASDVVGVCRKYRAEGYETLPKILSVDVARFGDDETVVGCRQGRKFRVLATYRGLAVDQVAGRVCEWIDREQPAMTVVDGGGVGGGVIDVMRSRGYGSRLHEYNSGHTPLDAAMYKNKRAEVWGTMREWLMASAEIPDDPSLEAELTGTDYFFTDKQQLQLESKDDMKARGLSSPDKADCLAMTFAVKVVSAPKREYVSNNYGSNGWMQ